MLSDTITAGIHVFFQVVSPVILLIFFKEAGFIR